MNVYIFYEWLIQLIITYVVGATFFKDEDLCWVLQFFKIKYPSISRLIGFKMLPLFYTT